MVTTETQVRFRPSSHILAAYLKDTPVAHALFRAAELAGVTAISLPSPVLDLGCGQGQFARLAVEGHLDVGVDLSETQLWHAQRTGCYARLVHADARELPFEPEYFQSIIAISSLEHMAAPEQVTSEVFRVLKPAGCFVATVVLADLHRYLFFPRLFRRLGLSSLARFYIHYQDRLFHHTTLLQQTEWENLFIQAGFEVLVSRKVVGPALTAWWDFLLLTAWPHRLGQPLGCSFVWHPRWFRAWVERRFRDLLAQDEPDGSVLLIVGRKPSPVDPEQSDATPTERCAPLGTGP